MNRAWLAALSVSFASVALLYAVQRWSLRTARRQGDLEGLRTRAAALPYVRSGERDLLEADLLFWSGDFAGSLDRLRSMEQHRIARRLRVRRAQLGALNCLLLDRSCDGRSWLAEARRCADPDPTDTERVLAALFDIAEGTSEDERLEREKLFDVRPPLNLLVHLVAATFAETAGERVRARAHLETVIAQGGCTFVAERALESYRRAFPNERVPAHAPDVPARVSQIAELARNFWCGQRLLGLRPVSVAQFARSSDQLGLLLALNLVFALAPRWLQYTRGASPLLFSLESALAWFLVLFLLLHAIGYAVRRSNAGLEMSILVLSSIPLVHILAFVLREASPEGANRIAAFGVGGVFAFAIGRSVLIVAGAQRLLYAAFAVALYVGLLVVPFGAMPAWQVWYVDEKPGPRLESERLLFTQPERLHQVEHALLPETPGVPDLYFIAVASFGSEDVFVKEARFARRLFDERFGTRGRSILLANDETDPTSTPLASLTNLERALRVVGAKMNRQEDVLFLFMTSHGTRTKLSVELANVPLQDITPESLRSALDVAAIKWRVLVISACESGGFVQALEDDFTLVATAAATDKKSFGCGSGREFTVYGKALFAEALTQDGHFLPAFARARRIVRQIELDRRLEASEPQLFIGGHVAEKLKALEESIARKVR